MSIWGNTLVDGHNRYAILQKHPEICFSTMPLLFESREEVLAWICKNQLGRRNLTPEQKLFLIGKQYEAERAEHGLLVTMSSAQTVSLAGVPKMGTSVRALKRVSVSPRKTVSVKTLFFVPRSI